MSIAATVGIPVITGVPTCIHDGFVAFGNLKADQRFLLYLLKASEPKLREAGQSGSQLNVNTDIVRGLAVRIPEDRKEQERIAEALWDLDDQIVTLERLIVKKQTIKHGLMQQILTGKTRLFGFTTPWVDKEIGELLEFKNGLNKGSEFFGSGTPIVNFMDVMNGPIIRSADLNGRVTLTRDEIKRFSAKAGDLFFTRTSESVDEVGTAAALIEDVADACFSGFILRGRPRGRDTDSRFLARVFQLAAIRAQVTSSATYTTRALTNGRSLSRVVISLPTVEEQRAIADLIDSVDTEIEAFRVRLVKARSVKTGMMQQLLTGRIRLPAKESTA